MNREMTKIIKKLRDTYYGIAGVEEPTLTPSGGTLTESIGAFPAFYIQGNYCKKSLSGLCTPCFYSRYPNPNISKEILDDSVYSQCRYILDNFESLVLGNQYGKIGVKKDCFKHKNREPIALVISPTGSYFSEHEFSQAVRIKVLKELLQKCRKYDIDIVLHIEAHAEDIVATQNYLRTSEELQLLKKLNAKVILGFESSNDFTRNILYNKNLKIETYEQAVQILQECNLDVGSFVFCGLAPHNNIESKQDMLETVRYLKSKNVFPVLMFPNIQPYTIPEVLYINGQYNLIEPFTVLSTISEVMDIIHEGNTNPYWLIPEPVGGPPMPMFNIFYNRDNITTSNTINRALHEMLIELRLTRNVEQFKKRYKYLTENNEYSKYLTLIELEKKNSVSVEEKVKNMLQTVTSLLDTYINEQRPNLDRSEMEQQNSEMGINYYNLGDIPKH